MNHTETSPAQIWFEERVPIFAAVGVLFFIFVVILAICACLCSIFFGVCTSCGQRYKKALKEKEKLVKWKKDPDNKNIIILPDSGKLYDLLDPRTEMWTKKSEKCTSNPVKKEEKNEIFV